MDIEKVVEENAAQLSAWCAQHGEKDPLHFLDQDGGQGSMSDLSLGLLEAMGQARRARVSECPGKKPRYWPSSPWRQWRQEQGSPCNWDRAPSGNFPRTEVETGLGAVLEAWREFGFHVGLQ